MPLPLPHVAHVHLELLQYRFKTTEIWKHCPDITRISFVCYVSLMCGELASMGGSRPLNMIKTAWWRHQMETFSALLAFVRGMHQSQVNFPHKGQRRGALMFSLICAWINDWANNRKVGDLRRNHTHYDVTVLRCRVFLCNKPRRSNDHECGYGNRTSANPALTLDIHE